jgi:hypothetical protein
LTARGTVVETRLWKRLGLAFFVMAGGLGLSLLGLG